MPNKNIPRLVEAFSLLPGRDRLRLVLAGWSTEAHLRPTLAAIERLGLSERVVVLRDVPDQELSGLYRHCSVFVFPSLYEGFGLPVLEALAHGAPVACSTSSSLPEVAGDAAVYFNPLATSDIAAKIKMVLDDRQVAQRLRERAVVRASMFSWHQTACRIVEVIHAVIRDDTRRPPTE
jgi:glycosyltransferase involved in cell wall biosynthesis